MVEPTPNRRFRISIRSMMIVVAVCALLITPVVWSIRRWQVLIQSELRAREAVRAAIRAMVNDQRGITSREAYSAFHTWRPVVSMRAGRTVMPSSCAARLTRWARFRSARIVTVPPPPAPLALNPIAPTLKAASWSASISGVVISGCSRFWAAQLAFMAMPKAP